MRGCSGTDEAGKEKKSQYTHYKKLDYTTDTGVEYLLKLNKENNPVICCESSRILESTVTQIVGYTTQH